MIPITPETAILTVDDPKTEKFLRAPTKEFPFSEFSRTELEGLIRAMRRIMKRAAGVGLSANQIGLPYRMFVAEVTDRNEHSKFYAIFNPRIEKLGKEKALKEEGCLSVPERYGDVERYTQVTLTGLDKRGKPLRIKAWGLLAHVFQHEVDHLDGKLFTDKAKEIYKQPTSERLKKREENLKSRQ